MTELAEAAEKATQILLPALDKARMKGEEREEFFRRMADAYRALVDAVTVMRIYGKIDPKTYERVTRPIRARS